MYAYQGVSHLVSVLRESTQVGKQTARIRSQADGRAVLALRCKREGAVNPIVWRCPLIYTIASLVLCRDFLARQKSLWRQVCICRSLDRIRMPSSQHRNSCTLPSNHIKSRHAVSCSIDRRGTHQGPVKGVQEPFNHTFSNVLIARAFVFLTRVAQATCHLTVAASAGAGSLRAYIRKCRQQYRGSPRVGSAIVTPDCCTSLGMPT